MNYFPGLFIANKPKKFMSIFLLQNPMHDPILFQPPMRLPCRGGMVRTGMALHAYSECEHSRSSAHDPSSGGKTSSIGSVKSQLLKPGT